MKYVIWGCGEQGKLFLNLLGKENIVAIVDSDVARQGGNIEDVPIISYSEYKNNFSGYLVVVTPAKAMSEICGQLKEEGMPFVPYDRTYNYSIRYLTDKNGFSRVKNLLAQHECICLYGFNLYSIVLFEMLKKAGKDISIIRDCDFDSEMPQCLENTYPENFATYGEATKGAICATGLHYKDKLKGSDVIDLYRLDEDYPYICSYSDALRCDGNPFNAEKRERQITVSLTTYSKRLAYVPYAIGTMLHQTMKPDRIVLYLDKGNETKLPEALQTQVEHGVEIHYVEDIGPHTKYFYAFQEYPDDIIITIDDDLCYRLDLIEKLYCSYMRHPNCVHAMYAEKMTFDENGNLNNYSKWKWSEEYFEYNKPSMEYSAMGFGGVLYPPKCVPQEAFNVCNIKKTCLHQDDLWLKVMETLNNIPVVVVDKPYRGWVAEANIIGTQESCLRESNLFNEGNQKGIQAILRIYNNFIPDEPSVLEKIRLNLF